MNQKSQLDEFTGGLSLPPMTRLQLHLSLEVLTLDTLAKNQDLVRDGADSEVYAGVFALGRAMDRLGAAASKDNLSPIDHGAQARASWEAVEWWILREAIGTNSARTLAVCYLAHACGITLDWPKIYSGSLDTKRIDLVEALLMAPSAVPAAFWRIFVQYREALFHACQLHRS
jgi:hypothetical protein